MTKRRRDLLKTCLGVGSAGALAGCTGLFAMGGGGQYSANLHNVTEAEQEVALEVANEDDDLLVLEQTYELAPGESVQVGDTFKQVHEYSFQVAVVAGDLRGEQSRYVWDASNTLQILILDDRVYFALPAS